MRYSFVTMASGLISLLVASGSSATPVLTTLATFNGANGRNPDGTLIVDASGNLYGTTQGGGDYSYGTVFKVLAGGGSVVTLATFNYYNGGTPYAGLIADAAGNLYGTTYQGGVGTAGTVFKVPAGGGSVVTLANFDGTNGSSPQGSLIADGAGNLYGTTVGQGSNNYGTVFKVPAGGGSVTTLATFNGTNGSRPQGSLVADSAGNLYGTTLQGGTNGYGTVFKVPAGGGSITTLGTFNYSNGEYPNAGLTMDAAGNLYGTASGGGINNNGTVFMIAAGGGPIVTLANFMGGSAGNTPEGGLLVDAAGNLYGTTLWGGVNNAGTVFEVPAGGGSVITLAPLGGSNGQDPNAGLVADSVGNLYGVADSGGAFNAGTVFELSGTGFVVPEPAGLSVIGLIGLGLLTRRKASQWRR